MRRLLSEILLLFLLINAEESDDVFQVSRSKRTWKDSRKHCKNNTNVCLATRTTADWLKYGLPDKLKVNMSVWVGGKLFDKLVWVDNENVTSDLFTYTGCYNISSNVRPQTNSSIYSVHKCYEYCRNYGTTFYIQDGTCLCKTNDSWSRVDDSYCKRMCRDSLHICGDDNDYYSEYYLQENIFLDVDSNWKDCYYGRLEKGEDNQTQLVINGTKINENISLKAQVSTNSGIVVEYNKTCRASVKPVTLTTKSSNSTREFPLKVNETTNRNNSNITMGWTDHNRTFWINLYQSSLPYWINEKPFNETDTDKTRFGCLALKRYGTDSFAFEVRKCSDTLNFLCSCDITDDGNDDSGNDTVFALVMAGIGVGILVLFLALLVTLIILKRMGKLTIQPASHGTYSQSDQTGHSSRSPVRTLIMDVDIVNDIYGCGPLVNNSQP